MCIRDRVRADPRGPARTRADPRGPARTPADPRGPPRTPADPRGPARTPANPNEFVKPSRTLSTLSHRRTKPYGLGVNGCAIHRQRRDHRTSRSSPM
eukprot:1770703-Prymnesium_polylepis.1